MRSVHPVSQYGEVDHMRRHMRGNLVMSLGDSPKHNPRLPKPEEHSQIYSTFPNQSEHHMPTGSFAGNTQSVHERCEQLQIPEYY